MKRIFQPVGPLALSITLFASSALAEPNDGEATSLAKQAMDTDYLGTQFDDAEKKLLKALDVCEKGECSSKVEAQLHLDLGVVYIAGLKKADKGKKEMQAAVAADGQVTLSPDFSTPEVEEAFEAAGGVPSDEEEDAPKPKKRARPKDDDEDEDDAPKKADADAGDEAGHEKAAGDAVLNWISVAFQQDILSFKDTTGVCTGAAQYQCFLQGQSAPAEGIYRGAGNQLAGGIGFGTKRILLGYDRVLGDNITLGAKVGFAFGGSPKATTGNGTAFLPLHAEARASYWFGKAPFSSGGLRPYAGLAFGVGEVDAHVTVEYFGANPDGSNNGGKGKLDAWRKTGNAIGGLHAGIAYAFAKEQQLFLELRVLQMFGATAIGGAVNVGYAYGM